ncbi:MAG: protein kinase [Kofleriaceae bacterium]
MGFVCDHCGKSYDRVGYCAADGRPLVESDDPLLGTEIGRYRLASLIGEGGMGRVYRAVQPIIGSRVAIKILSDQCARNPDLLERFFAEARAVNLIRHECIVSVLDMAKLDDGRPYIVMEFIDGQTLGQLVRGSGPAPLGGLVQVMNEVLSALAAAHAIGIVHRDLKPDNILITEEGHAKVLDFGIAKLGPGLANALSPRTATGALLGTPAYMSPEQITGAGSVDLRTDVYAAGVVLFEAVTGRAPFRGEALYDLMRAHLEEPPPSPRLQRGDLPLAYEQVILTALAKDPAHRFQSATAMAQALHHAGTELPPEQWRALSGRAGTIASRPSITRPGAGSRSAPPAAVTERAPAATSTRSRRTLVLAGATLLVTGAIVGIVISQQPSRADRVVVAAPVEDVADVPAPDPDPVAPAGSASAPPGSAAPRTGSAPPPPTKRAGSGVIIHEPPRQVKPPPGVKVEGDVTFVETGGTKLTQPADYNARAFDVMAYLPKATAIAKQLVADVRLTTFEAEWARPDGRVDLALPGSEVEYSFRSPLRSKLPPNHPKNLPLERPCMVRVEVGRTKVQAVVVTTDDCDDNLVRAPRCTLADVWKQAKLMSFGGEVAKISWLFDEAWYFDSDLKNDGSGASSTIQDVCP